MKEKFQEFLDFIGRQNPIRKIEREERKKRARSIIFILIGFVLIFVFRVLVFVEHKISDSIDSSKSKEQIIAEEEKSITKPKEEPELEEYDIYKELLEPRVMDIYYDIEKYFSDIQQTLRENPKEATIEGFPLRISQQRTIVVDGEDLMYNVDYDEPAKASTGTVADGTWISYAVSKREFYSPQNYEGELYDFTLRCMDSNGKIYYELHKVPYMKFEDLPKECIYQVVHFSYENGKEIPMYAPYTFERVHYIEKFYLGESVEKYILDMPKTYMDGSSIVLVENDRILITNADILGVFDIKKNTFSVISKDIFDIRKTNDHEILFTDSNHNLYWCNWKLNSDAILVEKSDIK